MPSPSPSPSASTASDGVLRIGTLLPTSGRDSATGPGQLAAVHAAIRRVNAAGGVLGQRVELVSRSSGDSRESLDAAFAELAERGVDAVIGPSDSVLASRTAQLAAEAGIPVVSPAATGPILADADGWLFRTAPAYERHGAVLGRLLPAGGQARVAILYTDGPAGLPLVAPLRAALAEHDGELVATQRIQAGADLAAVVAALAEEAPDAVVLATGDTGDLTRGAIAALTDAGLGHERLWLVTRNAGDYSDDLDRGMLAGAGALIDGSAGDEAFRRLVQQEDPHARRLRFVAEAFDAATLVALAAEAAGSDAGSAIRAALPEASAGGATCRSFGECLAVLGDGQDLDYAGVSGPVDLDEAGDVGSGTYAVHRYGDGNTAEWVSTETG